MTETNKLTATGLPKKAKTPGMYCDGDGLYLRVVERPSARAGQPARINASWIYRFMLDRRAREAGIGRYPTIGLADARERADELRKLRAKGIDPIEHRHETRRAAVEQAKFNKTFKEVTEEFLAEPKQWKNDKHEAQWRSTLEQYAYPALGRLKVQDIDAPAVAKALKPIWLEKVETASRLRQRIEAVLTYAKAHKYRSGDNPAELDILIAGNSWPSSRGRPSASSTTGHSLMPICRRSWRPYVSKRAWRRVRWN